MNQRVAVVQGDFSWSGGLTVESCVGFCVEEGGVDPDELRSALLDAVRPADTMVDDVRREFDWGASGPLAHDLLITVGVGVPAGVLSAALYDALRSLVRKVRRSEAQVLEPGDQDFAWRSFSKFLEYAMKASELSLVAVVRRQDHWYIRAQSDRGEIEGVVDDQGLIMAARLIRGGTSTVFMATDGTANRKHRTGTVDISGTLGACLVEKPSVSSHHGEDGYRARPNTGSPAVVFAPIGASRRAGKPRSRRALTSALDSPLSSHQPH